MAAFDEIAGMDAGGGAWDADAMGGLGNLP